MTRGGSASLKGVVPPWYEGLVRHYPVLGTLPAHLRSAIIKQGRPESLPAGAIAFEPDTISSALLLITRGCVRVVRNSPHGKEIMLYRVRAGESCILSVCCLLGRSPLAARGVIESEVEGVSLPGALFETLVSESPVYRASIFELFGSRIGALLQLLEEIAFHRLDHRLAALLLRRFDEVGTSEISITHQDLADQVGSAREVVSRLLESFENGGAIALGRTRVKLLRPESLRELSGRMREEQIG